MQREAVPRGVPVLISGPLRDLVKGQSTVLVEGLNIRSIVENLDKLYPGFLKQFMPEGSLNHPFRVYVNRGDRSLLACLDTQVTDSDEVIILSPMSGG